MKNWLPLLMAVVGGWLLIAKPDLSKLETLIPSVVNTPAVPAQPAPSAEMQGFVAPIKAKLTGHPEKSALVAALYRDFAAATKRDNGRVMTSTTQFLAAHKALLEFRVATGEPSIGVEIDAAIEKALGGKQAKKLDPATTARLVEVLQAISWSAGG